MKNDVQRILKAMIYIENHYDEELKIEELAKIACYSTFHFQRLFQFVVGENVYQYIQRLRLEKAAQSLRYTSQQITDIALDASYATPSAFAKAFKKAKGKSPRDYRTLCQELNMNTDKIAKKLDDLPMIEPHEITNIKDIPILFARNTGNYWDIRVGQFAWDILKAYIKDNNVTEEGRQYFTITLDNPEITEDQNCRLDACISNEDNLPAQGEVASKIIPGGKYATFYVDQNKGDNMEECYHRISLKWLPKSNEEYDDKRPHFIQHLDWTHHKIYIPLK